MREILVKDGVADGRIPFSEDTCQRLFKMRCLKDVIKENKVDDRGYVALSWDMDAWMKYYEDESNNPL